MNQRVQDLFHEIADLSPASRARYFAERGIDHDTQKEVEALLVFDSGASAYLQIQSISPPGEPWKTPPTSWPLF